MIVCLCGDGDVAVMLFCVHVCVFVCIQPGVYKGTCVMYLLSIYLHLYYFCFSGMNILREELEGRTSVYLLSGLADVWTQFYTTILPTVLAIFYPIQEQGIYLRSITLIGFRDFVLLQTKIRDALIPGQNVDNKIKQMLLVLCSVHDSNPPNENYMKLEYLVTRVVRPYLGFRGLYLENKSPKSTRKLNSTSQAETMGDVLTPNLRQSNSV